jgi:hypothetical protein
MECSSTSLHLVQLAEFEHRFVELQSFSSLILLLDVFAVSVVIKAVVCHVELWLQHFGKEQLEPIRKEPGREVGITPDALLHRLKLALDREFVDRVVPVLRTGVKERWSALS